MVSILEPMCENTSLYLDDEEAFVFIYPNSETEPETFKI